MLHQRRAREIWDRAREFQHAMVAASREPHAFGRIAHEIGAGGVGTRDVSGKQVIPDYYDLPLATIITVLFSAAVAVIPMNRCDTSPGRACRPPPTKAAIEAE